MNLSMQLAVVMAAACLCLSDAAPDTRVARKSQRPTRGFKNVEMMTARGFGKRDRPPTRTEQSEGYATPIRRTFQPKCCHLLTAQRFGKRDSDDFSRETASGPSFDPKSPAMFAGGFGKRDSDDESAGEVYGLDNFWEMLESAEKESQEGNEEKTLDSIPMDYFVNELLNNPDFARSVVRKFIDLNQDGMLSTEELLRNV